jgi:predicted amidohydrolase
MSEGEQIRLAAAQLETRLGDIEHNLDLHLDALADARRRGCDLVVFPELSLTGYAVGAHGPALARSREGREVRRLAEAAEGITAVVGLMEEGPAAQLYNSAVAVRDGQVEHLHRKINLPNYGRLEEGKHFAAGRFLETAPFAGPWRYASLICADAWNPGLVHLAATHGATLLLLPISSAVDAVGGGFSNPGGWATALGFYAMIYGLPVVMANRVGTERDHAFWGGSRIVGPEGQVLAEAGEGPGLVTADIAFDAVREARWRLPTVRDANFALIFREMARLSDNLGVPEAIRAPK